MGNRPYELSTYQLSGKRYTPSFLQGHPSSLRFGHPDVTTGDTVLPRLDTSRVPHISSAPTQGHPSPGRSALSLLRCGERPCDTLRALPENTAAPATQAKSPHTRSSCGGSSLFTVQAETGTYCGKAVSSVATSGCPSSASAGAPVGARTNTAIRTTRTLAS